MASVSNSLLPLGEAMYKVATPFQKEDAYYAYQRKRVVLGHKTGLGKTFISLLAWAQLPNVSRVLVVGSLSSINTWKRQLKQWGGAEAVIMTGASDPSWAQVQGKGSGIWLCTYATAKLLIDKIPKPKGVKVDLLICDELHKALRNRTATYKAIKRVESTYFFGLTATWASKGPQDLWPVLNIIDHRLFSSYWKFVDTYCFVNDASFGKEVYGVRNGDKLKAMMSQYYYRTRTWKEVAHQFLSHELKAEPVIRRTEVVAMDIAQQRLHDGMITRMEAVYGKDVCLAQNSLDRLTRGLQLALSPKLIFPDAPVGGPVAWLADRLMEMPAAVVFIPYKGLASIVANHARASGYTKDFYSLLGGLSPDVCDATIADWKLRKGVIFCTISYAQSFALDIVDNAYFLGFDWDPNNNIQAEGRLRRMDSVFEIPCLCTYIVPESSDYEKVKEVINGKIGNVRQVLQGYGL